MSATLSNKNRLKLCVQSFLKLKIDIFQSFVVFYLIQGNDIRDTHNTWKLPKYNEAEILLELRKDKKDTINGDQVWILNLRKVS